MFVIDLSFGKDQIVGDTLRDIEDYLKLAMEQYVELFAYEFIENKQEYELCFFTFSSVTLNVIEFIKNKIKVSGLIGKLEIYENKLIYGGKIYGKRN